VNEIFPVAESALFDLSERKQLQMFPVTKGLIMMGGETKTIQKTKRIA
jgi:hypothetical protein